MSYSWAGAKWKGLKYNNITSGARSFIKKATKKRNRRRNRIKLKKIRDEEYE